MKIAISGKFSDDVFDEAFRITSVFKQIIKDANLDSVQTELQAFVYFPVIVSDALELGSLSHRSFSRREMAEFVNVEIPISQWSIGNDSERLRLIVDGFGSAIVGTSSAKISDESKKEICARIRASTELHGIR